MTKLEERLNHAADEDAKLLRPQDSPLEMNRRTFKAGAKFILQLPELKALLEILESSLYVRDFEAPEDSEVKAIGERIGFGALLDAAVKGWHQSAKEKGYPPGGAFTVGHCHTTVKSVLTQWREFVGKESETL